MEIDVHRAHVEEVKWDWGDGHHRRWLEKTRYEIRDQFRQHQSPQVDRDYPVFGSYRIYPGRNRFNKSNHISRHDVPQHDEDVRSQEEKRDREHLEGVSSNAPGWGKDVSAELSSPNQANIRSLTHSVKEISQKTLLEAQGFFLWNRPWYPSDP